MRRHLNITVRWKCLFSDLYSAVVNVNQHEFSCAESWIVVHQHFQ